MKTSNYYIYRSICTLDGRTYVGKRMISLWFTPAKGMEEYTPGEYYGSGDHIKNAIKKYGVENFCREVIAEYHGITKEEIKNVESDAIKAEWAAGHGEFNHSANSYGGNIFDGMSKEEVKEITSNAMRTKRERYGDPCRNLHTKKVRALAAKSMVATQIEKYGSAMGQCHTDDVVRRRTATLKDRYGAPTAHCNTDEAKLNRANTNLVRYGSTTGKLHTPEVTRKTNRKFKYLTPEGEIREAQRQYVKRYKLNWTLIGPVEE